MSPENTECTPTVPGVLEGLVQSLGHLLNGALSLCGRQQVSLVQDDHHAGAGELADQQTLSRLGLDALYHIHHQHHQVNDLGPWDKHTHTHTHTPHTITVL